ncbi:DUF192 domain-containing protein [Methanocaldococcus indicus]|uniref:DUF192 domain-containing protein n=1 Tax=Methanocaldococcus indicus TaxID=213231 RepID=UPI003C6D0429
MKIKIDNLVFDVEVADNFIKRAFGLMFRDIKDKGLLFLYKRRKISVHTFFVFYPIDILFIDNDIVVETTTLKPWRFYKCKKYSTAMLEFKSKNINLNELIGKKVEYIK